MRSRYASMGGAALTPVDVIMNVGDSNTDSTGSSIVTDLPVGYWGSNDNNVFVFDDRTSGNIIPFKYPTFATVTISNATPGVVTWNSHGLAAGDPISFMTTGTLPTGLSPSPDGSAGVVYYVTNVTTNTFQVATTYANAIAGTPVVNTSSAGSGVHTGIANACLEQQPSAVDLVSTNSTYLKSSGAFGESLRQYRIDNPTDELHLVNFMFGGGSFYDTHGVGRPVNFNTALSDGACATILASWLRYVAKLAAQGKRPRLLYCRISGPANSVLSGTGTEISTFQTDLTNLISWLRTNIIGSSTKVVLERISVNINGGANAANATTARTAQQNIVTAVNDKTLIEMTNTDDQTTIADNVHFTMAAQIENYKRAYYCGRNIWHPYNQWAFQGQTVVAGRIKCGDLRNLPNVAADGTGLQTLYESAAGKSPTQATAGKRAPVSTTALSNGYRARFATYDGVDDIHSYTVSDPVPSTVGIYAAFSAPATAGKCLFGAGGTSSNTLLLYLNSDGSGAGKLRYFARNDNVSTAGDLVSTGVAFNNIMNAVDIEETAGSPASVVFRINGATESAQTYTRGTLTPNRYAVGGVTSGGTDAFQCNAKVGEIWWTAAPYTGADIVGARTYRQREYGTP